MKKRVILGLFFIYLILPASMAYPQDKMVVATIDDSNITFDDLKDELTIYGKGGNFYEKLLTLTSDGKRKILDKMVKERLFYKAAIDTGIKLDEEAEKHLRRLRQNLIVKKYIQTVLKKMPITKEEMISYYKRHNNEFVIPEKRKVRHIVVKTKEEADKILKELKDGRDFAELAGLYNIDGTKKKGGDLGWIRRGTMVKEFGDVAFSLQEQRISDVVKTRFGYHLILVEEIKKGVQRKYEKVKRHLKTKVEEERIRELEKQLKDKYNVRVDYRVLENALGKERGDSGKPKSAKPQK